MMEVLFYIAAAVALGATVLALTRSNAAHALIFLIVSLLAVAVVFLAFSAILLTSIRVCRLRLMPPHHYQSRGSNPPVLRL